MTTFQKALDKIQEEIALHGIAIKQAGIGMHRICEIELLQAIAAVYEPKLYIELGCGAGHTLKAVKEASYFTQVVGYENYIATTNPDIRTFDVFSPECLEDIKKLTPYSSLFIYTDNGHKITELDMMAKLLKPGDIIGTHDYPNEVVDDRFLIDQGLIHMTEFENYIEEYASLQRFWRKP